MKRLVSEMRDVNVTTDVVVGTTPRRVRDASPDNPLKQVIVTRDMPDIRQTTSTVRQRVSEYVDMTAEEIAAFEAERKSDLDASKRVALDKLEIRAAAARGRHLTAGKDGVYAQKQREALAILDDPSPTASAAHPATGEMIPKYNHLRAMIGLWVHDTGNLEADMMAAARFVLGRAEDAKAATAAIERTADLAKVSISNATTADEVRTALMSVAWP